MSGTRVVTVQPHQVRAAKLAVRIAKRRGREPDPGLARVADARPRQLETPTETSDEQPPVTTKHGRDVVAHASRQRPSLRPSSQAGAESRLTHNQVGELLAVREVIGTTAFTADGDQIGRVGQVYFDDVSGEPEWVTVNTGFFGSSENFVPVRAVEFTDDRLVVLHDWETIKHAPSVGADGHLDPEEERALYNYYGVSWGDEEVTTRPEDRAPVDPASEESGGARLRRYVVTEHKTYPDAERNKQNRGEGDTSGRGGTAN